MKYNVLGMVETGKYSKLDGQKKSNLLEKISIGMKGPQISSKVMLGEAALMNSFPLGWISNYPWKVTAASNFRS